MMLFSQLLDKNITFPEDNEKTPHDVLEEIILYDLDATVSYKVVACQNLHCVCSCSIEKDGRIMEGIGETHEETLSQGISQRYPVRMARKRAFDFAAVRFLKLPIKEYEQLLGREEPDEANIPDTVANQNEAPKQSEKPKQTRSENKADDSAGDYTQIIVSIGRHKGEDLTVAALAQKDIKSLMWIANDYPQNVRVMSEERKKLVEACRRWLEEHSEAA